MKKRKNKMVKKLEIGYCPLSMRLGAGLGAGQAWAQAGVQGAGRRRVWLACGRARRACWRWAWAQARVRQASGSGAGARRRQRRAGVGARRRWGGQALGRSGERHGMGAQSASGRAAGRAGARAWAAATSEERGGARQAQAGARGAAGWAACARLVCAAGPGWVFWCT